MPELPDFETFRRFLNRTAIGKTIEKIDVRDKMILRGLSARTLQAQVRGKEVRLKGPSWEVRVCLASAGDRLS
jgi:formamidopyrimidine-DNA glycosylase